MWKNLLTKYSIAIVATLATMAVSFASAEPGKAPSSPFDGLKEWDLGIYSAIVFLVLLGLLSKFAWPQITAGLKAREESISLAKDEAVKAKKEAEETRVKLQAEYTAASDKIRAMMDEARRDADVLRAKERETGVKEAATERDRAKREIETAKDQALQEIYQKSVEVASLMSSKAIKRNMSAQDHSRLIDEALADLKLNVK